MALINLHMSTIGASFLGLLTIMVVGLLIYLMYKCCKGKRCLIIGNKNDIPAPMKRHDEAITTVSMPEIERIVEGTMMKLGKGEDMRREMILSPKLT